MTAISVILPGRLSKKAMRPGITYRMKKTRILPMALCPRFIIGRKIQAGLMLLFLMMF